MTPLSQRDSRWSAKRLGWGRTNNSTIGSHGCTITSLAMLLGKTPDVINDLLIKHQAYAAARSTPETFNLVWWGRLTLTGLISSATRVTSYNNDAVKAAIEKHGGCLVEVDGSRIGASRHWVLYIGNGQMADPWTGVIKSTSYYPPVGYAVIDPLSSTTGTMPEKTYSEAEMTAVRLERDKNWNLAQEYKADAEKYKSESEARKEELQQFREDLAKRLALPMASDQADLLGAVDRLLEVEDQLNAARKEIQQVEKKHEIEVSELKSEIEKLRVGLQEAQETNTKLLARVDDLEVRIEAQKEAVQMTNRFSKFIEGLLVFFRRK